MSAKRLVLVAILAVLSLGALGAGAAIQSGECNGIRVCLRAYGPWVAVPARGEAQYLLDCPRRRGILAGVDAEASSSDIHPSFQGQLGAPVAPGITTARFAFFSAVSGKHRRGYFQPRIGCVPVDPSQAPTVSLELPAGSPLLGAAQRTTTAAHVAPGPPLLLAATNLRLRAGTLRKATIGCVPGQRLVDSWTAIAFRTVKMPQPGLADAIKVTRTVKDRNVSVEILVSEALPAGAAAEVQLGVKCSVT